MNDSIEDGAVCGIDGCSPVPTPAQLNQNSDPQSDYLHDLTIVSDVICPWCFVAKRNLEKALGIAGPGLKVKITWRPFELNPGMPKEGMNRREYRSRKFGSWAQSQALDAQVAEAGKVAGLTFHHDLMERTPNTFNAHRLIWLAAKEGVQDRIVESLFRAYFTEGRDVGDTSVLSDVAAEAGIAKDRTRAFLESSEATKELRLDIERAQAGGVSGVPTFILDGETLFSGAQKPATMAARLRKAAASHAQR